MHINEATTTYKGVCPACFNRLDGNGEVKYTTNAVYVRYKCRHCGATVITTPYSKGASAWYI